METQIDINIQYKSWQEKLENLQSFISKIANITLEQTKIIDIADYVEISFLLCDDEKIRVLNKQYRNQDKATNVLSFEVNNFIAGSYESCDKELILGDVVLAFETILKESDEQNKTFESHLSHMIIHGILHLLGYDHFNEEDAMQMESLEINTLSKLDIDNPYL